MLGDGHPDEEHRLVAHNLCLMSHAVYIGHQEHAAGRERAFFAVSSLHLHAPSQHHHKLFSGRGVPITGPTDRTVQKANVGRVLNGSSPQSKALEVR